MIGTSEKGPMGESVTRFLAWRWRMELARGAAARRVCSRVRPVGTRGGCWTWEESNPKILTAASRV